MSRLKKNFAEAGAPHTYLPISGIPAFTSGVQKLIFGPDSEVVKTKRAATVQSLGGTGALKVGADFLATVLKNPEAVVSAPTWQNHVAIFESAGFKVGSYPYYDKRQVKSTSCHARMSQRLKERYCCYSSCFAVTTRPVLI